MFTVTGRRSPAGASPFDSLRSPSICFGDPHFRSRVVADRSGHETAIETACLAVPEILATGDSLDLDERSSDIILDPRRPTGSKTTTSGRTLSVHRSPSWGIRRACTSRREECALSTSTLRTVRPKRNREMQRCSVRGKCSVQRDRRTFGKRSRKPLGIAHSHFFREPVISVQEVQCTLDKNKNRRVGCVIERMTSG